MCISISLFHLCLVWFGCCTCLVCCGDVFSAFDYVTRYGPTAMVLQEHYVDYVKSSLLGFFLVHPQSRSQTVVLCCTMWDNASPGLKAKLQKEAEYEKADILSIPLSLSHHSSSPIPQVHYKSHKYKLCKISIAKLHIPVLEVTPSALAPCILSCAKLGSKGLGIFFFFLSFLLFFFFSLRRMSRPWA